MTKLIKSLASHILFSFITAIICYLLILALFYVISFIFNCNLPASERHLAFELAILYFFGFLFFNYNNGDFDSHQKSKPPQNIENYNGKINKESIKPDHIIYIPSENGNLSFFIIDREKIEEISKLIPFEFGYCKYNHYNLYLIDNVNPDSLACTNDTKADSNICPLCYNKSQNKSTYISKIGNIKIRINVELIFDYYSKNRHLGLILFAHIKCLLKYVKDEQLEDFWHSFIGNNAEEIKQQLLNIQDDPQKKHQTFSNKNHYN